MAGEEKMGHYIAIEWTCGSLDEARHLCRLLVQERLIACAQIIPRIESVYLWDGQLETAQESKVVLKTRVELFEKIQQTILAHCQYELPEITYRSIEGGYQPYLDWVCEQTGVLAN
jgi:periplasmic divalent cation tolerance protein